MDREEEKDVSKDVTSVRENESSELNVNTVSEEYPCITVETAEDQIEAKLKDSDNDGNDLSCPSSSNDENNFLSPNVDSEERHQKTSNQQKYRSTSLKSNSSSKSPNPKIVRFADALGLDLTAVRHFSKHRLPNISQSAFADLKIPPTHDNPSKRTVSIPRSSMSRPTLVPRFHQPGAHPEFFIRTQRQKVCLENVRMVNFNVIQAVIRVRNLGFRKDVRMIYTRDSWKTKLSVNGEYLQSDPVEKSTDIFKIDVLVPYLSVGERLDFVIQYLVNGQEFWDNNFGRNYVMDCVADCSIVNSFW